MADAQVQREAAELTPAQQVEAATAAVNASNELAKTAGPLLGGFVTVFTTTLSGAPDLFIPALSALLGSPFPLPPAFKAQLRKIIANAKKTPAAPPKVPAPRQRSRSTPPPPVAQSKFPTVAIALGGVAVLGIAASLLLRKKGK